MTNNTDEVVTIAFTRIDAGIRTLAMLLEWDERAVRARYAMIGLHVCSFVRRRGERKAPVNGCQSKNSPAVSFSVKHRGTRTHRVLEKESRRVRTLSCAAARERERKEKNRRESTGGWTRAKDERERERKRRSARE